MQIRDTRISIDGGKNPDRSVSVNPDYRISKHVHLFEIRILDFETLIMR